MYGQTGKIKTSIDDALGIQYSLSRIYSEYGDSVSVSSKNKDLLKFGRNQNVGSNSTGYTIWFTGQDQSHETYVNTNLSLIK